MPWGGIHLAASGLGVPQGFLDFGLRMSGSWRSVVYSGCCDNTTGIVNCGRDWSEANGGMSKRGVASGIRTRDTENHNLVL